jgi:GT2 family glycosyltransferase
MNAQRKEIGCVGPKILNFNDKIKSAGIILGTTNEICNAFTGLPENNWTSFGLESWSRDYRAISPECLMIEKDKFIEIGKFDENIEQKYESYIDLCLRVYKKGYQNLCLGMLNVYSFERDSKNRNISDRILKKATEKYKLNLEDGDPYHNQNLSLENAFSTNISHQK